VIFSDDFESGNTGSWGSDGVPTIDIIEPADGAVIQ